MNQTARILNESLLSTNVNDLAHNVINELALAVKKTSIYALDHPTSNKAIEKAFFTCNKIFRFKRYINLNYVDGFMNLLNIRIRNSTFADDVIYFLQINEIDNILFDRSVTYNDFALFIERLGKREKPDAFENLFVKYLKDNGIASIEANCRQADQLYETHPRYRGDSRGDFSIKNLVLHQLADDLELLTGIVKDNQLALDGAFIDYDYDVIEYLLPEKMQSFNEYDIIKAMVISADTLFKSEQNTDDYYSNQEKFNALYRLVNFHPQRSLIIDHFKEEFDIEKLPLVTEDITDIPSSCQTESSIEIFDLLGRVLDVKASGYDSNRFSDAFKRLLMTGQKEKAESVMTQLVEMLEDDSSFTRQKGLDLLANCLNQVSLPEDNVIIEKHINTIVARLDKGGEAFEYSEFIWQVFNICRHNRRYDYLSRLTSAMARLRRIDNNVTVYESIAVKKAFDNINQSGLVNSLVDELIVADHETGTHLSQVLIDIGSDQVAIPLSNIISHSIRRVRQTAIKILAALGKSSLKIFSLILMDDSIFERDAEKYELPDSKWYVIRNSIFVLGLLKDIEAIAALRLRVNDKDVRVRREIISALEKIGGEDACDMLLLMAEDPAEEICEKAILTVGLIGNHETIPLLVDLVDREPSTLTKVIPAMGQIGGNKAREFLINLLFNEELLSQYVSPRNNLDQLRILIIKALARIGDSESIEQIKVYRDQNTSKKFFKTPSINKTIDKILMKN